MKKQSLAQFLACSIFLILFSFQANARIEDSTLDFAEPGEVIEAPEISIDLPIAPLPSDAWSSFFAKLTGFTQVKAWGIALEGALPFHKNESLPLAPASVQKLVTTASALRHLGADAQFSNFFEGQVDVVSKVVSQVRFTVSGDPTWGHELYEDTQSRLAKVIHELKAQGVTKVVGPIEVVSTHPELDLIPVQTGWPKRWTLQCMATQTTAFMFHGNCGSITVSSLTDAHWTTPGVDVPIQLKLVRGATNALTITPTLNASGRVQSYTISGQFAKATSTFYDPLQDASTESVPVHLSTRWLQNLFRLALQSSGIGYSATELAPFAFTQPMMVDLSSLPLIQVLRVGVQQSINSILDRVFYETAFQQNTAQASSPSYDILRSLVSDPALLEGVEIQDGSGLVINDRLRSDLVVSLLKGVQSESYFSDYLSTLAVAGRSGTLVNRLTGPLTKGKIFAKTGTINGIYNLAGYFHTPQDTYEPFSLLTSSTLQASQVRGMLDKITTQFAGFNAQASKVRLR